MSDSARGSGACLVCPARAAAVAFTAWAVLQAVTALAWMNPLTARVILTPEFGQSPKLIAVWTRLEPLPRITENPPIAMMFGYFLFTLVHVAIFVRSFDALPGRGWFAKGAWLGTGILVLQYGYFEFFGPFNQYHEPARLIAYELLLQGLMAFSEGLTISRMLTPILARRAEVLA